MNQREFYMQFINFLIDKGYSEAEIAASSNISTSTINRAKNGLTKLGRANQILLDKAFDKEKREFEGSQGIETEPSPKDKEIEDLKNRIEEYKSRIEELKGYVELLKIRAIEQEEVLGRALDENDLLKEEIKRLKGE